MESAAILMILRLAAEERLQSTQSRDTKCLCAILQMATWGIWLLNRTSLEKSGEQEAVNAAKVLGAEAITIDVGDFGVESADKQILKKLVEVVRSTKPDVIITHNPDDYMRDHMQASKLAYDASFVCTVPHFETLSEVFPQFPPVFYMDTLAGIGFIPTEYVDISQEIELKLEAIDCHESQVKWLLEHDNIDFLDFAKTCSKYRGLQASCKYAEGFRQYAGWPRFRTRRMLP